MERPSTSQRPRMIVALIVLSLTMLLGYRAYEPYWRLRPTVSLPPRKRLLNLNTVDRGELIAIPGIGETLADAILSYRDEHTRFERLEDLNAVRGIGPKTIETLRPWVKVEALPTIRAQIAEPQDQLARSAVGAKPASVASPTDPLLAKKFQPGEAAIDINTAPVTQLLRLPGVGQTLAARIIVEREKQPFSSVEDLRRVSGVGAKTLEKIRPWVKITPKP
jgi:competence protein ComEA